MKTYVPKEGEVKKEWLVIDAEDQILGRVAAEAAKLLRGKHKPQFTPHMDCGDHVIIVNADKARVTGSKGTEKIYYHHSQYPGGLRELTYNEVMQKYPTRAMMLAVKGMLPKNKMGHKLLKHLRVYAGGEHPHVAQGARTYEFNG
ncbi:MAG: 50S ribosomal protein L13 [Candidatus Hydrogenedentota bacterium]